MVKSKVEKVNIYESVTARLIEALEKGVNPWRKPWNCLQYGVLRNADTNRPYRGLNTLLLNMATMAGGYSDPRWLTYKNAEKLGGTVKKGEKGTQIIFWNFLSVDKNNTDPDAKDKKIPFARAYTVFNVEQCEGIKVAPLDVPQTVQGEVNEIAERIIANVGVISKGTRAFYSPSSDTVTLPPAAIFESLELYYSTFYHEAAHRTGHPSRLDRDFSGRFGDEAYAFEELVAEIGASFLCSCTGIPLEKMRHPEYIASWLKVLKNDNKAIFTAAGKAQNAVDFILDELGAPVDVDEELLAA